MNIRELRLSKGVTQRMLADAVGVDVSVISRYESGKTEPPFDRFLKIVDYLNGVGKEEKDNCSAYGAFSQDILVREKEVSYLIEINKPVDACQRLSQLYRRVMEYNRRMLKMNDSFCRQLVRLKANGKCELCKAAAPFTDKDGSPHLEIYRVNEDPGQTDSFEKNYVALCPNCHAKIETNPSKEDLEAIKEIAASHSFAERDEDERMI